MIRYDNLKPAVIRVLLGRERFGEPAVRRRCARHYGYDSFFCAPGIEGAHEKGGVEGEIGRFRRRHLTPVPQCGSLAALNDALAAADARDDARRIAARAETVGAGRRPGGADAEAVAGRARSMCRARCRAGWTPRPGSVCGSPTTRCRLACAGRRVEVASGRRHGRRPGTTAGDRRPARPVAAQGQPRTCCWTTTWRCWPQAGRVRRVRPRWPRPGPAARSPMLTNGSGTRPAARLGDRARHPGADRGAAAAPHPARRARCSPA